MRALLACCCVALLAAGLGLAEASDNGKARVPPIGWNSWCTDVSCTKCEVDLDCLLRRCRCRLCAAAAALPHRHPLTLPDLSADAIRRDYCTEEMVHRQTDAVATHLKPLGWSLITLDDCWGGGRLANGSYSWDPVRFPSGMPALAQYVKSKGLELGLYMAAGNETCNDGGRPYKIPGSYQRYEQDAATVVGWGVTYIKLDWCGSFPPLAKGDPEEMRLKPKLFAEFSAALNKTGVPVYFSGSSALCNWENTDYPPDFGACAWAPKVLNAWRIGGDHHDWWYPADDPKWKPGSWAGSWGEFSSTRYKIENLNTANQAGLAGPGGYNDPDFLFTVDLANAWLWCAGS